MHDRVDEVTGWRDAALAKAASFVTVKIRLLRYIEIANILTRAIIANFYEHVTVDLREIALRKSTPRVQAVAVLRDYMLEQAVVVELG